MDDSDTNQETAQNDNQESVIKYYDPSTGTYKYYKKTTTATEAPTYLCYYPCYTNPYPYYSYQPSYGGGYGGGYGGNLFSIGSGFNIGGFGIGSGLGISLG